MKKYRVFLAAAILTLVTAGVFAKGSVGKRFVTAQMYASTSPSSPSLGNSIKLSESVDLPGFATSGTNQSQITNNSSVSRYVFAYDGSTFTPLYASGW
ncbi:MAG: hypothetical protein E6Q24_15380 [Chitinophagaceae bacterium]|nr:MAG: hypothetical protein E6Q24_15380 [Chitinophagaceae bacterium]